MRRSFDDIAYRVVRMTIRVVGFALGIGLLVWGVALGVAILRGEGGPSGPIFAMGCGLFSVAGFVLVVISTGLFDWYERHSR